MNWSIFYSDPAILLYECIIMVILIMGIVKLSKSKKQKMQQAVDQNDRAMKQQLNHQLSNNMRR